MLRHWQQSGYLRTYKQGQWQQICDFLLNLNRICRVNTALKLEYTINSFHHHNPTYKQTTSMNPCVSMFQYEKDDCHMSCGF
jgi:hypothetical protein